MGHRVVEEHPIPLFWSLCQSYINQSRPADFLLQASYESTSVQKYIKTYMNNLDAQFNLL